MSSSTPVTSGDSDSDQSSALHSVISAIRHYHSTLSSQIGFPARFVDLEEFFALFQGLNLDTKTIFMLFHSLTANASITIKRHQLYEWIAEVAQQCLAALLHLRSMTAEILADAQVAIARLVAGGHETIEAMWSSSMGERIDQLEFLSVFEDLVNIPKQNLSRVFVDIDSDGDGFISQLNVLDWVSSATHEFFVEFVEGLAEQEIEIRLKAPRSKRKKRRRKMSTDTAEEIVESVVETGMELLSSDEGEGEDSGDEPDEDDFFFVDRRGRRSRHKKKRRRMSFEFESESEGDSSTDEVDDSEWDDEMAMVDAMWGYVSSWMGTKPKPKRKRKHKRKRKRKRERSDDDSDSDGKDQDEDWDEENAEDGVDWEMDAGEMAADAGTTVIATDAIENDGEMWRGMANNFDANDLLEENVQDVIQDGVVDALVEGVFEAGVDVAVPIPGVGVALKVYRLKSQGKDLTDPESVKEIGVAAAGAAGFAAGAAAGQVMIPIPVLGAVLGGMVGAAMSKMSSRAIVG